MDLSVGSRQWISCQLGAREHYAIPRALHSNGQLSCLITDLWVPPGNPLAALKRNLRERFEEELLTANIRALNLSLLGFEARAKVSGLGGWELVVERNKWFQQHAVDLLERFCHRLEGKLVTLFAYSYAALGLLQFARARDWKTVLGQIDPGLPEERIVEQIYAAHPEQQGNWLPAPAEYWEDWRRECALADHIVVNSTWSGNALIQEGIEAEKIVTIPLAYSKFDKTGEFIREYPNEFTQARPLRVLFLGQVNLRKGTAPLLKAIKLLHDEPIEFWFVGPIQITVPESLRDNPRVKWVGAVPRKETSHFYRRADVFIFPTFSDGFGLTQLEAQAWKLPIIASRFCGDVVQDEINGVLLKELSGEAITSVLHGLVRDPGKLTEMAERSGKDERFKMPFLASSLIQI